MHSRRPALAAEPQLLLALCHHLARLIGTREGETPEQAARAAPLRDDALRLWKQLLMAAPEALQSVLVHRPVHPSPRAPLCAARTL